MTPGTDEAENELNISTGQPELGKPTLTVNPPAELPAEQPKEDGKDDAAGSAEDKD